MKHVMWPNCSKDKAISYTVMREAQFTGINSIHLVCYGDDFFVSDPWIFNDHSRTST